MLRSYIPDHNCRVIRVGHSQVLPVAGERQRGPDGSRPLADSRFHHAGLRIEQHNTPSGDIRDSYRQGRTIRAPGHGIKAKTAAKRGVADKPGLLARASSVEGLL